MAGFDWLVRAQRTKSNRAAPSPRRLLRLEVLESREVPSAVAPDVIPASQSDGGSVLVGTAQGGIDALGLQPFAVTIKAASSPVVAERTVRFEATTNQFAAFPVNGFNQTTIQWKVVDAAGNPVPFTVTNDPPLWYTHDYQIAVTFPTAGQYTVTATALYGTLSTATSQAVAVEDANDHYVSQIYPQLLGRYAGAAEATAWGDRIRAGWSRTEVALAIEQSPEYRARLIQIYYSDYLGRAADPAGMDSFLQRFDGGDTIPQIKALFLGSAEYLQRRTDGTFADWLDTVYSEVLGRPVDAAGLQSFGTLYANGASRTDLALLVVTSTEAQQKLVQGWYAGYLHRVPDATGFNTAVGALLSGQRQEWVESTILGSDEYFRTC